MKKYFGSNFGKFTKKKKKKNQPKICKSDLRSKIRVKKKYN
jgi:hypothetical protein